MISAQTCFIGGTSRVFKVDSVREEGPANESSLGAPSCLSSGLSVMNFSLKPIVSPLEFRKFQYAKIPGSRFRRFEFNMVAPAF